MSEVLKKHRKYTWGNGLFEYSLFDNGRIYCHKDGTWMDPVFTKRHIEEATSYTNFRYVNEEAPSYPNAAIPKRPDNVRNPAHYQVFEGIESIEIIARSMTQAEFKGFCLGNVLKYRLRAGKKSELATMEKDLKKADFYKELFEQHKAKCYA